MYAPILAFFGQTFAPPDVAIILLLVVLEGVLSIDNALVLGLLAKRLPKHQQQKALTYGLVGAFVFRLIAIALAVYLLHWWIVKLFGGAYLIYIALKHFFFERGHDRDDEAVRLDGHRPVLVNSRDGEPFSPQREAREIEQRTPAPITRSIRNLPGHPGFWATVLVIELTDIAFAIDSILAAIAMIPHSTAMPNPKLWVVVAGGFFGVVLMRFAAYVFIKLLERFPRLEISAYLLVLIIGAKLVADWWFNKPPAHMRPGETFHGPLNFHSPSALAFWVFWGLMVACFAVGFIRPTPSQSPTSHSGS